MNTSVLTETDCSIRNLKIKTFNVIPITNWLGMLEWVDGTEPLKQVIVWEHGESFDNNTALKARWKWLQSKSSGSIAEQHIKVLDLPTEDVGPDF